MSDAVTYDETNIKTLKDAAHIRQNPGMYVGNTSTAAGLRVKAKLDSRKYRTGVEITKAQMRTLALRPHEFHGEWHYELQPRELSS